MLTPIGLLADLDTGSRTVQINLLRRDKHAVLEGMIGEDLIDQVLDHVSDGHNIKPIKVRTCIASSRGSSRRFAFVWSLEDFRNIIPYLDTLAVCHTVYPVTYDSASREFLIASNPYRQGAPVEIPKVLIQDFLSTLTRRTPDIANLPLPDDAVRNADRQMQAIWGYLSVLYGRDVFNTAVLPRVFMNFAVQPFFDFAWDVDRVFNVNGTVTVFEVKHKFPYSAGNAHFFGINTGSMMVLENIIHGGAQACHLVLVKPYWDFSTSSMYLLGNLEAREKALLVGCRITASEVATIKGRGTRESGAHTTFTGRGSVKYYPLPLTDFRRLGILSAKLEDNARNIAMMLTGAAVPPLTESDLVSNHIS